MAEVDFFVEQCQRYNITASRFGVCDPKNGGMAYVDFNHEKEWIAVVENRTGVPLNFTAIDNCVEIRRENGDMDNRCDAMLTGGGYIVFIELKDQRSDWINHAVTEQLQTTIEHFKANHNIFSYAKRFAYACNRRQPRFQYSNMELMNEFRRRNNVRLCIVNEIVLK